MAQLDNETSETRYKSSVAPCSRIEQAHDRKWSDAYFDNEPDIIVVFDHRKDTRRVFKWFLSELLWAAAIPALSVAILCFTSRFLGIFLVAYGATSVLSLVCFCYQYCYREQRLRHVAVTKQGVRVDKESTTGAYRSILVPFASIHSVKVACFFSRRNKPDPVFPGVLLVRDSFDFEKTWYNRLLDGGKVTDWMYLEKQKEFVDLVLALKQKEEEQQPRQPMLRQGD